MKMRSDVVVAALGSELDALRKSGTEHRLYLETGIRGENSANVLRSFLKKHQVQMVWNIGFAGALSPLLNIGDLVIDPEINQSSEALLHRAEGLQKEGFSIYFGRSIASRQILLKGAEKTALARSVSCDSFAWVDMESSAVAAVCVEHKLPLFTVRCISDLIHEDLRLDLNKCFDSKGRLRLQKLLKEVPVHPAAVIDLLKLYKRSRLCSEKLASFITRMGSSLSLP